MCAGLKLDTPIERALPAATSFSKVFQVETYSFTLGQGPVDQEQIDIVQTEALQASVQAGDRAVVALVSRRPVWW